VPQLGSSVCGARHGKRDEGVELLRSISNCFTEGHDTRDFKEAKVLLDAGS
jgi:hypothetical protein